MDKPKFKRQGNILCPLVGETLKIHGKGHGYGEMWRIGTNDIVYQCWGVVWAQTDKDPSGSTSRHSAQAPMCGDG